MGPGTLRAGSLSPNLRRRRDSGPGNPLSTPSGGMSTTPSGVGQLAAEGHVPVDFDSPGYGLHVRRYLGRVGRMPLPHFHID